MKDKIKTFWNKNKIIILSMVGGMGVTLLTILAALHGKEFVDVTDKGIIRFEEDVPDTINYERAMQILEQEKDTDCSYAIFREHSEYKVVELDKEIKPIKF